MESSRKTDAEARQKYVDAFNDTMARIWHDKIAKLDVIDTWKLYHSVEGVTSRTDDEALSAELSQRFVIYGLYQDAGTGRETPRGNPGDIGRDKKRERRQWFSRKYYASVMNIRDFFADSIGREFCGVVASTLDPTRSNNGSFNF